MKAAYLSHDIFLLHQQAHAFRHGLLTATRRHSANKKGADASVKEIHANSQTVYNVATSHVNLDVANLPVANGSGMNFLGKLGCTVMLMSPAQSPSMDKVELLGFAASLLVVVSWLPQLQKSLKAPHMKEFSLGMLSLLLTSQVMFLTYGVLISSLPVALTNAFTTVIIGTPHSSKSSAASPTVFIFFPRSFP